MPTPTATPSPSSFAVPAELLRAEFGIEGELVPLSADRGATCAVVLNGAPTHVVKIGPALTDADRARLDLQAEVLRHAHGTLGAVQVPLVVPDRQGRGWHPHAASDGTVRPVLVTTWVPGDPLSRCRARTPALLRSAGRALASATLAMARIPDSVAAGPDNGSTRPFAWDLLQAGWIVPELERSTDPALREFLPIARRFLESTLPAVTRLPQQLLHNDWNDDNILVTGPPWPGEPEVTGLIDFGDMVRGPAVVELGIGLAYLVLDIPDPLAAACHVIEGYRELRPLADEELHLLWDLVRMRWALSGVHAYARRSGPAADTHHQVSQAPIRRAFEATRSLPDGVVLAAFRRAAGLPPVPHREAVLAHLHTMAREGRIVPVMGDLRGAPVLDLSASNPHTGPGAALDADTFSRWIDSQRATHPSGAAIGRWNEPRLLYQSKGFGEAGAVDGTARTVHIGLDIFLPAGTPVRAPLDAVVFTVADNIGDLDYGPTVVLEHETPEGHRFHTLHGHLSRRCLAELAPGTTLRAGAAFASIGEPSENGGWPPHLHLQLILTAPDPAGDYPGVAPPDWRTLWTEICPNPAVLAGLAGEEDSVAVQPREILSLIEHRHRLTGANLSLSYAEPLVIVRGEGQYLYDHEGRRFLDGVNNVAHVGHGHRRVVAALNNQAAVLNTNTRYLHPLFLEYTERLTALFPDPLEVCFLVNSGSEANELALRLARAATGRSGVVAMRDGYHGNTGALVGISGYKHLGPGGQGTPRHVQLLATPGTGSVPDVTGEMARACAELEETGTGAGAFICEPILSCAGQVVLPAGYLKAACAAARSAGALCVIDEVQTGIGRVGTAWWAFEEQGIVPDIVTLGKPLGNGHPMGAVITTRAIADAFANGMEYFNTFGGNPVSCAVGLAVLDVIDEEDLRTRAAQLGARLQKGLRELAADHPLIGDVRGRGLFLGVELVDGTADRAPAARQARYLVERMKENGVLLSTDGPHHNVIKIKPPLVLEERDVDRILASMEGSLKKFEV